MTKTTDVLLGKDIKKWMSLPDFHNISDTRLEDLDDYICYFIEKEIGYNEKERKSGVFITKIREVIDKLVENSLLVDDING